MIVQMIGGPPYIPPEYCHRCNHRDMRDAGKYWECGSCKARWPVPTRDTHEFQAPAGASVMDIFRFIWRNAE